jgi:hypothetical protein
MYRIIDPGFRGRAEHALRVAFGHQGNYYIDQFFRLPDSRERLYAIRNGIKHGTLSPESRSDLIRVEGRISQLWLVVWRLLAIFLGTFHPYDTDAYDVTGPPPG